jgi:hypothetical protein
MKRKQRLTIVIELKEGQKPYPEDFLEHKGETKPPYNAMKHFFEDINYKVVSQKSEIWEEKQ